MTDRRIIRVDRAPSRTYIYLECGHARSLGGHRYSDGSPVPNPADLVRFRTSYDCQDGTCYDGRNSGGACDPNWWR